MKKLIYLLFTGLTLIACNDREDFIESRDEESTEQELSITNPNRIKVESVSGRILDENGDPVAHAKITTGETNTSTDANGDFSVENVMMNENLGFVKVEKEGYFSGSRSFASIESGNEIEVTLMKKELVKTFNASFGTSFSMKSGDALTFKPNSIKNEATGAIYRGTVNVYAKAIDVEKEDHLSQMPGDLVGVNKNGSDGSLYSYGMLYVELETPSGEKLNIANTETVKIEHPIPASMLADAPEVLPFWFFDETKGYWSEYKSSSYKIGNKYVVEVPHFTKLNWDDWLKPCWIIGIIVVPCKPLPTNPPTTPCPACPTPPIPPKPCPACPNGGDVILPEALTMSGATVLIHLDGPNGKVIAQQKTSPDGSFKIKVPKNFTNKYYVEVVNKPNKKAVKETLKEFKLTEDNSKSQINIGIVTVAHPKDNFAQTYGTVTNCDGNAITGGKVNIIYRKKFMRSTPVKNGFYGIVYATSDNLSENINEVIKIGSETVENTFLKANKYHRIDFQLDANGKACTSNTSTEIKGFLTYNINGVSTTYSFTESNQKLSYKGGIYIKASETKDGLDKLSQGVYVLLPDFKGTGTYNASVLILKTVNGHTVTQQNPAIKVNVTSFDEIKGIIKGDGKGTFTDNNTQVPIEFNFEMVFRKE